jgi:hypothetical protein
MSPDRFDEFTKALATGASRRGVLKGLAAAVAGGALTAFSDTRQAEAVCSPVGGGLFGPQRVLRPPGLRQAAACVCG